MSEYKIAPPLRPGDTIGIIAPCSRLENGTFESAFETLRSRGYRIKKSRFLYSKTNGYAGSEEERVADRNEMALDDEVKMVLFTGGYVSNEILPLIDYAAVAAHPKLYSSYSDGTSILNAIWAKTGLVTYYGQDPGVFCEPDAYNDRYFESWFVHPPMKDFVPRVPWQAFSGGTGEGVIVGGYTLNFAMMMGGEFFPFDETQDYLLILEDHEAFNTPAEVSALLSHIGQSRLMKRIRGLIFGDYSDRHYEELDGMLRRFGLRYRIPVVYCHDFGHGRSHAVLPIGVRARLDADRLSLRFL